MNTYGELENRFRRLSALSDAASMLHWDSAVHMPAAAAPVRAEQLAELKLVRHEILTADDLPDMLDAAGEEAAGDSWRAANVGEMRRLHVHASAVEPDLVAALTKTSSACEMLWRDARPANDFAAVEASLTEVVGLVRRMADAKAATLGCDPYDALIDQYEPGARIARIQALFDDLAGFLPDFLERVLERQAGEPPLLPLEGPFPVEDQRALGHRLMECLGFEFERGRLDVSLHPFCGGVPDDVRITTRYDEDDFAQALMGVIHETGHALYEMGLPADWRRQPVGTARGMALHESQSLLFEMQVCRGPEFIAFAAPLMRNAFGGAGPAWHADNIHRHYTRVVRSLIRVDADEVTYPLHVILRTRLERAIIADDLAIADIPGAWRDGMRELVGIAPEDDTDGCLQDIHWFDGTFGYFPTYTMGALAAAQLFAAAKAAVPEILGAIGQGDFAPLLTWLRANVHLKASSATTDEIMAAATGAPLGAAAFEAHLNARYFASTA
jgi:carboxypeptidase Taq